MIKELGESNIAIIYGKSGTGVTTTSIKAATYVIERNIFEYFFFIDLYEIKDDVVFRFKFNEVTGLKYNSNSRIN